MGHRQLNANTARKTLRLEAFQDGVLAIAMTLPLAELILPPVPQGGDLAGAFQERGAEYVAYLSSALVIGVYWTHSHFSGKIIRATDHTMNLLSLVFLVAVSATSVPNTPFFEHFRDTANVGLAATFYAWVLAAPSAAWLVRWIYAVNAGLVDRHLDRRWVRTVTLKNLGRAVGLGVAALITTAGWWQAGMALSGLLILTYLLPPTTPAYIPGLEPESEIEEADERISRRPRRRPTRGGSGGTARATHSARRGNLRPS